jgi:hypothetical protein
VAKADDSPTKSTVAAAIATRVDHLRFMINLLTCV